MEQQEQEMQSQETQEQETQEQAPSSWRDEIDEAIATSPAFEKFNGKTVNDLATSYYHLEKKLGGNPIVVPSEDSPPEQWEEYYTQLGRPKDIDGYELEPVEKPEGFNDSAEYEKALKEAAYKTGANNKQANEIWKSLQITAAKDYEQAMAANEERVKANFQALEKEWGAAFKDKVELANRAVEAAGGQELVDWMKQTGADKQTALIKAFAKFGEKLKEDSLPASAPVASLTPREAISKINKIRHNQDHAYNNPRHPGHAVAVKEVADLYEFAYPGEADGRTGSNDEYEFGVR